MSGPRTTNIGDSLHDGDTISPPPVMSAHINGPLDAYPFEFYNSGSPTSPQGHNASPGSLQTPSHRPPPSAAASRSMSMSPSRQSQTRSTSGPALISARSNPALAQRPPGSVMNMANMFEQGNGTGSQDWEKQDQRSRSGSMRSDSGARQTHRRYAEQLESERSLLPSFETSHSHEFNDEAQGDKTRDHSKHSPKRQRAITKQSGAITSRPLFGEITPDGSFHGNFNIPGYEISSYGDEVHQARSLHSNGRRQSESNVVLDYGRYQSQQETMHALSPNSSQALNHKRSRSDMDAYRSRQTSTLPNLLIPSTKPLGSRSQSTHVSSPNSRIPVSSSRYKSEDDLRARPGSTFSNPSDRKPVSRSPTRRRTLVGKENVGPGATSRSRYQPPTAIPLPSNQMLSAKIVAPPPQKSPPLRSSRPRLPVSSATTSASRARAAERFQGSNPGDGRRPSEQWLGKPYEPHKDRSRRKIPELSQVDFAERRARIQNAINKNLDRSRSQESRKSSRQPSFERGSQASNFGDDGSQYVTRNRSASGAVRDMKTISEQRQDEVDMQTNDVDTDTGDQHSNYRETDKHTFNQETAAEDNESPVLGTFGAQHTVSKPASSDSSLLLLAPAVYNPNSTGQAGPPSVTIEPADDSDTGGDFRRTSLLENVMRMRRQHSPSTASRSGTEFADESATEDSPSDLEGRWGLGHSPNGDQGSINIMLDDTSRFTNPTESWDHNHAPSLTNGEAENRDTGMQTSKYNQHRFTGTEQTESPVELDDYASHVATDTPQMELSRDETLKASAFQPSISYMASNASPAHNEEISRMLGQYRTTGTISPDLLRHIEDHMVDLKRISANGGSDAILVQNLLDSVMNSTYVTHDPQTPQRTLQPTQYQAPLVTPDTPPDAATGMGTALVYSTNPSIDDLPSLAESEDDFEARIRKADEDWERQHRGHDVILGASNSSAPTPPPKDFGYTPRSSIGPASDSFAPSLIDGLRISTSGDIGSSVPTTTSTGSDDAQREERAIERGLTPPPPSHAPPPPPPTQLSFAPRIPYSANEGHRIPSTYSERESTDLSPRLRKHPWGPTDSSRPSMDSQRVPVPAVPGSLSMSSLPGLSTRASSIDTGGDSSNKLVKTQSPGPEQKRLLRRRHIIKELLDTENSYHQDLKIIEDIYKATVADLVSSDDRKTLFGNCDEIERFSLRFYDELRKAVSAIYVPPKQMRWLNKRESQSTTHSDNTGQTSIGTSNNTSDSVDDDKDRTTAVGQTFLNNLQQMDQVYHVYLKNHDAANQRLASLKSEPSVKCWLDECHNNASDITSAWDLDSLLVKPTQRVSKYPMLLQQLLDTTPPDHPDHEALKAASKDTVNMLTRINEAKKRADIVDQIISRKTKDSDVRSGLAKAFGRRTEKLKERVGIAEAYQDKTFDDLVHKFGGHYIRLQICMRDVQDYLQRIDKSMDQINNCASALELFTDVNPSSLPEIESKWRRYGQAIREIAAVAFPEHKAAVQRRVIDPMITCIKLHQGPQNAINQRKKRILDYAKCQTIEKRGEKPDKKTLEASEMYLALNEHLKLELPKLYNLTAILVQSCLTCFLDIQLTWYNVWERKLRPTIDAIDIPASIQHIEPAFRPDYNAVKDKLTELGVCNGSLLAESSNFLSPTSTLVGDSEPSGSGQRTSSMSEYSKRTRSVGSESTPNLSMANKRNSGYGPPTVELPSFLSDGRIRSNSTLSNRGTYSQTPYSGTVSQSWSSSTTPNQSHTPSRPETATTVGGQGSPYLPPRASSDYPLRSSRPSSSTNYGSGLLDRSDVQRFSGIFNSALPPGTPDSTQPSSPRAAIDDMAVMFVCASLFEFSIDKTRREGGYPYLTYVQGEVFDVVAQKGELWLAKNQDDSENSLGWIWEQHFVILSGE